ncbi:MAG: PLP-dependent aminotransferase family protein [Solirubrobacteraceae bacterium]
MDRATAEAEHEARWWSLEPRPGETLRVALERTLRTAILAGALREGVALPASRVLARDLGVSRGVVCDAYEQLASQGLLIARSRAVPVVAAAARPDRQPAPPVTPPVAPRFDLTPTTPDVTLFPLARWLAAVQRSARRAGRQVLDYRDPRGELILRQLLADRLGRTRGVTAEPAQIVVTQGTAQSLELVLRSLRSLGATHVAVEDPSQTALHERVIATGLALVAQRTDGEGVVVDGLAAGAVVVTPAHQFPTGSVLSGERRRQLLAWARATGGLIVEDDYDAEFRYDREPVRALQGLAPDHVIQIGTVSKTLAPALRLGWLVVTPELIDQVARHKRLVDDFSPSLTQLALAELIARGDYDRHLRRARAAYAARRERMLAALQQHLPECPVTGAAAGVHVVLRLPASVDDRLIASQAKLARISVPALSSFAIRPSGQRGLVIGYGRLHESAVAAAVRELARLVRPHLVAGSPSRACGAGERSRGFAFRRVAGPGS